MLLFFQSAYQLGQWTGRAVLILLVVLIIWKIVKKLSK